MSEGTISAREILIDDARKGYLIHGIALTLVSVFFIQLLGFLTDALNLNESTTFENAFSYLLSLTIILGIIIISSICILSISILNFLFTHARDDRPIECKELIPQGLFIFVLTSFITYLSLFLTLLLNSVFEILVPIVGVVVMYINGRIGKGIYRINQKKNPG